MSIDKPRRLTPEELFAEAVHKDGRQFSEGDMRLLTKGLQFLQENQKSTINDIELNAIKGIIAYVAHTQDVSQDTVISILTSRYNVNNPKNIPSNVYPDAIEYLVDLEMKKIVN